MYLKVLVVCLCVTAVVARRKSGDCPPSVDIGECDMTCFSDTNCAGKEKCCRTTCGGTFCVSAITMRKANKLYTKPGFCPEIPTGPWVCTSRCSFDGDCRGHKKCCTNRCGAMACTTPE